METKVIKIDQKNMCSEDFAEASKLLREGRLVAFPTETVYGLGGDAFDKTASARIYAAKGRPSDNPLIVHIADIKDLTKLASEVPESALRLAEKFWPGPLTMILNKKEELPKETTGGLNTVAIRMPSHPIAKRLIEESGVYIAAPSANASGRPSTTRAEHVIEDLDGRIDMIIDGGSADIGLESTIVDLTCNPPLILRPGYITIGMLREILPDIEYDKAVIKRVRDDSIVAKAPGMKYKHYAPKGDLTIYEGSREKVRDAIIESVKQGLDMGKSVGILASDELYADYMAAFPAEAPGTTQQDMGGKSLGPVIEQIGSHSDEAVVASRLFDLLREFDHRGVELIYAESFESEALGQAIMNRMFKAAGYHIVTLE